MNLTENVKLKEDYTQVCVWPHTILGDNKPEDFEKFIFDEFKVRCQFLEVIETESDLDSNGNPAPGTGGRSDLFFAIHKEDVGKFAVPRLTLQNPIRWIEDVLSGGNYISPIYPNRVFEYKSWEA
jgi:hypothetical protein